MVDAARNTAWDLGKQPNNYRSNYPTQEWARRCDRALYRYEATRAVIASRWGWLEAQIADVECKIHQHARAHVRLRHLNRYNTSALSDHSTASRTSTNPVLVNRPAYTCVTRANINGINSGLSINGATSTHAKSAAGGASDSNKTGLANCGNDADMPRKRSNLSNNGNVPRLNTSNTNDACPKRVNDSTGSQSNPNIDTGGSCNYTSDTTGPRLHTKDSTTQLGAQNEACSSRASSCAPISSPPESNSDDGCARTKGLRWHRKRRWIRVGNIFEHGRGRAKEECIQSDVVNHLVIQPTLSVSCRCVAPLQCVMCTTLKARCNVPRSGALYSNTCNNTRNSSSNNNSNNLSQVNGMQTPMKKALSSASLSPSPTQPLRSSLSPLQFTLPRCSGPYSSSLLPPSVNSFPHISRISSEAAGLHTGGSANRATDSSTHRGGNTSLRSMDTSSDDSANGTTLLCKNAWYPRVAASSRLSLSTRRPQLLHERLASKDLGDHPLLSCNAEIPVNIRTESVLKSRSWYDKVASLVGASIDEVTDATSLSGAQASSLPGYCGLSSSSSRRHKSNNHHSDNNRRHRRHGDDAVADDELYTPHKSSAKKKKKSKDKMKQRSKDRDEKRKEKKKRAFKRKEKLEQKGRLTLRLRKSSVTGELVATPSNLPGSAQLYHHADHHVSSESGRGRGRHSLSFIPDDASSIQSSSRASSPSLPPHSPVESRSVLQLRYHPFNNDARLLSRNNATRPHSPADINQGSAFSPSPVVPRTPVTHSFVPGGRSRNNTSKSHLTLDRCLSSSAESGAAAGIAARRATVHSSLSTALNASTNITGPLSAPVLYPASSAVTVATSSATSGPTVTPAAAAAVALRIKQGAASYDIDNIVIPYNMASVTRVEHIEYKEIVTPKWREIDEPQPLPLDQTSCPVLEEDVCDTTVVARHEKSEELERLRFAAHLTTGGTRHGGNTRVRQRSTLVSATTAAGCNAGTSSTGTNTPDNPSSPHVDVSDLATPPATPLVLSEDSNHSSMSALHPGVTTDGVSTAATGDRGLIPDVRSCDANQDMGSAAVPSSDTDKAQGSYRGNKFHNDGGSKTDNPAEEPPSIDVSITSGTETATSPTAASISSMYSASEGSHELTSGVNINTASAVPSSSAATITTSAAPTSYAPGVSQNIPVMVSGPRKLRNATQTTTRLRTNSNNSIVNFIDDESNAREVSPYPIRKFPLSDSQFASMVQENSEVIPYPAIAAAHHPLLRSLDYDDLGEPSSDEHEHEADHVDDAGDTHTGKKRKLFESSVPSSVTEIDPKRRQKKISPDIVVQDVSGLGIVPSLSNLPIQLGTKSSRIVDESQFRSDRNVFSAVKKPSALVTFKDHLKKTNEGECGSEGRSSPLSEVTDSAAEDEMTGDFSDSSKPPDWTISATADSAGHCVMQVLRH
ncbi:PEHE domain [Trinorchestia longiramus]|nr:PEHE domain [Trinorchestia longiramus]